MLAGQIIGATADKLEGTRELVRSQETNLGDIVADSIVANIAKTGFSQVPRPRPLPTPAGSHENTMQLPLPFELEPCGQKRPLPDAAAADEKLQPECFTILQSTTVFAAD